MDNWLYHHLTTSVVKKDLDPEQHFNQVYQEGQLVARQYREPKYQKGFITKHDAPVDSTYIYLTTQPNMLRYTLEHIIEIHKNKPHSIRITQHGIDAFLYGFIIDANKLRNQANVYYRPCDVIGLRHPLTDDKVAEYTEPFMDQPLTDSSEVLIKKQFNLTEALLGIIRQGEPQLIG